MKIEEMKIAIISRHPAPYRDPMLAKLSSKLHTEVFNELQQDEGHSFWDLRTHGYMAVPLFGKGEHKIKRFFSLMRKFVFGKYDFVLWSGFLQPEIALAIFLSALIHRRFGFVADTISQSPSSLFKRMLKKYIAKHASLILVPGNAGLRFWSERYGVCKENIVKGAYSFDNEGIARDVESLRLSRGELRKKYGVEDDDVVFLMVANFIPTRLYPITTAGFLKFASERKHFRFVLCGGGAGLEQMQRLAEEHQEIRIIPGCSFEEMKELYAIADVYVHGGMEPASTALTIGAMAGLPLISSDSVGCSADVLKDGVSGVRVGDVHSDEQWAVAFAKMLGDRAKWWKYGEAARKMAKELDVNVAVCSFISVLERVCGIRQSDPSMVQVG